jgi:LysM repeat protein
MNAMRRPVRNHPLQSFRFWFLILASVAAAAAWKLDLFGNRHDHDHSPLTFEDLPAPSDELDEEFDEDFVMMGEVAKEGFDPAPEPVNPLARTQAPPAIPADSRLAETKILAPEPMASQAAAVTPAPMKQVAANNPFGPANPQFVAAPGAAEAFAGNSEPAPMPEIAQNGEPAGSPSLFSRDDVQSAEAAQKNPLANASTEEIRRFDRHHAKSPATAEATPAARQTAMLEEASPAGSEVRRIPFGKASSVVPASEARRAEDSKAAEVMPAKAESAPVPSDLEKPAGSLVDLAEIDRLTEEADDIEAHRLMSQWYWKEPQSRPLFQERIDAMARRIYLQPQSHYMEPYVVQAGDVLETIAKPYDVSWQYLAKLNRTEPRRIRAGQKLKVIKGPFGAIVDLRNFELTIHAHGYYVKRYQIGIGRDGSSPVGTFKVQDKLTNPTYYGPDSVVEADDPQNPLGEFWIGLGQGYGIHGTVEPDSIGKAESKGCIRLRSEDIADVFDFLTPGSEVTIRR